MWQRWYPDSPFQDCTLVLTESDVHNILHAFIFQLGVVLHVLSCFSCVQLFATPWTVATTIPPRPTPLPRLLCPWDSPGKITGAGCHALLLGISLTQGLNQGLLCLPALASGFFTPGTTWRAQCFLVKLYLWARVEDIKAHICEILFKLVWKTTS